MRCLSWEEAIGQTSIPTIEKLLCGKTISSSEVDALFSENIDIAHIYVHKGTAFELLANEPSKARECYKRALDLDLKGSAACLIRIKYCPEEGSIASGVDYLKKSIQKFQKPTEKELLIGKIGLFLYLEGSFEEATKYYERAYNLNNRVEWLNGMACSKIKMGEINEGKGMLEKIASTPHIPKIIIDNYNKANLLSDGIPGFHSHLNMIIEKDSRGKNIAEELQALISSASELDLISKIEMTSYEQLIALARGATQEAIEKLSSQTCDLKQSGSSVQYFIFEKVYKYINNSWPGSYSPSARKAIQNNCNSQTIQQGLKKWESNHGYSNKALKWALIIPVQLASSEEGEKSINTVIEVIKYDSENLKSILDKDAELKSIVQKPLVEERIVKYGRQMTEARLDQYRSDAAYNDFDNTGSYFNHLRLYYDTARKLFPSNPDLLEDYAYILKLIRSRESLPQAIRIYEQIIRIDPSRTERVNKKIGDCQRTLEMVR